MVQSDRDTMIKDTVWLIFQKNLSAGEDLKETSQVISTQFLF